MTHPLELNAAERERFLRMTDKARAVWRRAIEACTNGLPSWAERGQQGLRPTFDVHVAVAMYRAGGVTLKQVADRFGVTPQAIGHHVRKARAA